MRPHASGSLYWSRGGERFASINFCVQNDCIVLSYKSRERGGEWEELEYPVWLERTRCNYGGMRTWFLCPARGCGRRVATLFGGRIYACRRCYGLAYLSQRQSQSDRATDRAERILKRLGWDDILTIFDPAPERPKGMHEQTYRKLAAEYETARYEAFWYGPPGALALYER
ncbi:MAG: hypothetical protein ACRYHB_13035 [Janthinobacterium lividum]